MILQVGRFWRGADVCTHMIVGAIDFPVGHQFLVILLVGSTGVEMCTFQGGGRGQVRHLSHMMPGVLLDLETWHSPG